MSSAVRPFCSVCRRDDVELRPYGRKGRPICFPCIASSPQREREARRQLRRHLRKLGGDITVGEEGGPRQFNPATDTIVAVDGELLTNPILPPGAHAYDEGDLPPGEHRACMFCSRMLIWDPVRKITHHEAPLCPEFADLVAQAGARPVR